VSRAAYAALKSLTARNLRPDAEAATTTSQGRSRLGKVAQEARWQVAFRCNLPSALYSGKTIG